MASQTIPYTAVPLELTGPPADVEPGSPEALLYDLTREHDQQLSLNFLFEDYYEGRHKLTFASSPFREHFGPMLAAVSDNWIPLVIGASVERLKPQGFLFGGSRDGDEEAWRIWQENYLDADAPLAFTEAAKHGESYLLIWPDQSIKPRGIFGRLFSRRSEQAVPRITVEHPSQMIVRREPGDRRKRAAALKRWQESDGSVMATLYLPDDIYYFQIENDRWVPRGQEQARNPLGVVPVVPLVNDPHMLPCLPPSALISAPHFAPLVGVGLGRSDEADVISTVDQINKLLCDMLVASEYAAFRQRWATGIEIPKDEDGNDLEPFKSAIDRLWIGNAEKDGPEPKFGEFSATDLSNYTNAIEQRIQSLAARTRTPPHYLTGTIVNASGDALKAAETGLASKVKGKQASFGESLEEAMRIAFAWMGDDRATDMSAEVDWAHAESRSESEYVDSLVKKLSIGVPKEQLWSDAGYSPQEIQRFKSMLMDEAVHQSLFGAPGEPGQLEPTAGS